MPKTNYQAGHDAEKLAADYLRKIGYKIRELNWKTRYCEIDIVAERASKIFFIEVKFRRTSYQGIGAEYITPTKLKQMAFAAEMWVQANGWQIDYQLSAISIDEDRITFIEDL